MNREHMDQVVSGLPTKSAKIRALAAAGYKRSEIADKLGVRYQHVRNVLVDDERRKGQRLSEGVEQQADGPPERPKKESERQSSVQRMKIRLGPDGRIVVPAAFREALGCTEDTTLVARLEGNEIRLYTMEEALRRVQATVREFVPEGVSLVDELISGRRRETEADEAE